MEVFQRTYQNKQVEFRIYTQKEADEQKIPYCYWKEAERPGWVLTDDGYVGQLLAIKVYNGSKFYIFSFGKCWQKSKKIEWEARRATNSWSRSTAQHWIDATLKHKRTKRAMEILANEKINHKLNNTSINWDRVGKIFSPWNPDPAINARRFFKDTRVTKLVDEKTKEIMKEKGITADRLLDEYMEVLELAKKNKDPKAALPILKDLVEFIGMNDSITVTATDKFDYRRALQDGEAEGTAELKMQRQVKEIENAPFTPKSWTT